MITHEEKHPGSFEMVHIKDCHIPNLRNAKINKREVSFLHDSLAEDMQALLRVPRLLV